MTLTWSKGGLRCALTGICETATGRARALTLDDVHAFVERFEGRPAVEGSFLLTMANGAQLTFASADRWERAE